MKKLITFAAIANIAFYANSSFAMLLTLIV